jgi:hypothetical protein
MMKNMLPCIFNLGGSQPFDFLNEDLEATHGEALVAALEHHEAKSLHGLFFMFFVKVFYSPNPCLHDYYKSWFFKRVKLINLSF